MAEERVQRRLAAILAADVVGYSRLMGEDEIGTRARFNAHFQELIQPAIANCGGRIVKTTGDGLLVEFTSVVVALQCAVAIQKGMSERNADQAEDRRIEFRIGVNSGDVIIEGDDIHGDGVNVAARLEGLSEPGGICISSDVYRQCRGKLDVGFEDLGEQDFKNIAEPVHTYRISLDGESVAVSPRKRALPRLGTSAIAVTAIGIIAAGGLAWWQPWVPKVEAANVEDMAFPLPDKPSIAVLPFENLSGDAKQDYLSDGITENITTALSRIADMFVIPRTTTRTYKGRPVKVAQVAEELGVRYVLEGSVQRSDEQVRVTATLIDALKGHHIWAERYDREVKDTFVLQDDIAMNVLTELEVKLTVGERARALRGQTRNLEAYQFVRRGLSLFRRFKKNSNTEARHLFQEAVKLDPNYATAWNMIGFTHLIAANRRWADPGQDRERALELAHKALAMDPSNIGPYILLSNNSARGRRYDEAIDLAEKAVALLPNNVMAVGSLASSLTFAGRAEEALLQIQRAKRLSPITPATLLRHEGRAFYALGRYEEAIAAFEETRARNPKGLLSRALLALTYADAGRMEEARAAAEEVLGLTPSFSAKGFVGAVLPYKDRTKTMRALTTLLELGLPE